MATKSRRSSSSSVSLTAWLALSLVVILLDQITKVMIVGQFHLYDALRVTDWFNIVRAHNTGAAFSFLADAAGWQRWFFIALGLAAAGFFIWMLRSHGSQTLFCAAIALLLGGALGNVIDRAWHGYVVDFLDFHWRFLAPVFPGGHFPAFNVADMAITGGAIGLILDEIRRVRRS